MSLIEFLDPEGQVKGGARKSLQSADREMWRADYRKADEILAPLLRDYNPGVRGFAELLRGDIDHFQLMPKEAQAHYRRAAEALREAGSERGGIFVTYRSADTELDRAIATDYESTKKVDFSGFDTVFTRAQRIRDKFLIAFGYHYRGLFKVARSDFQGAIADLKKAIELRQAISDNTYIYSSRALLALALGSSGEYEQGETLAQEVYQAQVNSGLQAAAYRTLWIIRSIQEMKNLRAGNAILETFTIAGRRTTTPFIKSSQVQNRQFREPLLNFDSIVVQLLHG